MFCVLSIVWWLRTLSFFDSTPLSLLTLSYMMNVILERIPGGSVIIIIISAPNENSQKASKSVNVLAAGSQDRICVNEHQN